MMPARPYAAIVMAASTGGIEALRIVLGGLHRELPVPVLVVQHTASDDAHTLSEVLGLRSPLPVGEAQPRQQPEGGRVYLAPPGYHLLVEPGPRLALSVDEKVCYVRPSADVLFESASDVWRAGLIGVVLTGANDDGARGLAAIRSRRGLAIVQSPDEALMREMPQAALDLAGADHVLGLAQIGPLLSRLCGTGNGGLRR